MKSTLFALYIALALPLGAWAQNAGSPADRFDFQFEGGRLEEFVAGLKKVAPGNYNIVLSPGAADVPLQALDLKRLSVEEIIEVVTAATRAQGSVDIAFMAIAENTWVIQSRRSKSMERELAIFPADELLKGRTVEDLVALIEKAFELAGESDVPAFNLHEETAVLMAMLTRPQREMVDDVFEVLREPRKDTARERQEKQDRAENEVERLKKQFMEIAGHLQMLEDQVQDAEDASKIRLQVEHRMAEREMLMIEAQIQHYMELIYQLRATELGLGDLPEPAQ